MSSADAVPTDTPFSPTSIHRALDHTAALKLTIQRMQRHLLAGEQIDERAFTTMLDVVDDLTETLIACRDQESG